MSKAPHLFVRLEDEDWDFVNETRARRAYDAAIVRAHYCSPYPETHKRSGQPPDRLLMALEQAQSPIAVDLAIEGLGHPSATTDRLNARHADSPLVRAIAPPVPEARMLDSGWQSHVADIAAEAQIRAGLLTAPGFEFSSLEDPRFAATLALVELTAQRAGSRDVLAQFQVTKGRSQVAAEAAPLLRAAGARRVLLQVRRLTPERASAVDVERYCHLIDAFAEAGFYTIADRVGRLGPVLAMAGVSAFSTGARYFRTVPQAMLPSAPGRGGGLPLTYEVPGEMRAVPRWEACDPSLPACPASGCVAASADTGVALREHLLHELRRLAVRAAANPARFVKHMRRLDGFPLMWAEGFDRYRRDTRAA